MKNPPYRVEFQRVLIPRRLNAEPETGLDEFLGGMVSAALAHVGLHGLSETLHAVQAMGEVHNVIQPEAMGQSETLARQAFVQNPSHAALASADPLVMIESWMPVRRPIDVLDPGLRVAHPALAETFQSKRRPTLGDALFGRAKPDAPNIRRPKPHDEQPSDLIRRRGNAWGMR